MSIPFTIAKGSVPGSFRFATPKGAVWAVVTRHGDGRASIDVSEEACALSAKDERDGLSDRTRSLMVLARNSFGTATVLRMMREVVAQYPDVREWVVDRITGANREKARVVRT